MKYRALVGLTLPINEAEMRRIERLQKDRTSGEPTPPMSERKLVYVAPGEIVPYMPPKSAPHLLAKGAIERVEEESDDSEG